MYRIDSKIYRNNLRLNISVITNLLLQISTLLLEFLFEITMEIKGNYYFDKIYNLTIIRIIRKHLSVIIRTRSLTQTKRRN